MAKNKQQVTDEVEHTFDDIGGADGAAEKTMKKIDPFENIPCFVPGKNWKEGRAIAGYFVRTKRVYSDKFTAGKIDPENGRLHRDLHIFRDPAKGVFFGIWNVGVLGAVMKNARRETVVNGDTLKGQYVKILYKGLGDAPLKAGQSAPHCFDFFSNEDLNTAGDMED